MNTRSFSVDVHFHAGGATSFLSILAISKDEAIAEVKARLFISHGILANDISKIEVS